MFRQKVMSLADWMRFQDAYSEIFVSVYKGDKRTALFIESHTLHEPFTLLIPAFESDLIESLSPGGWEDCVDPANRTWTLLVGNADARNEFGLRGPKI